MEKELRAKYMDKINRLRLMDDDFSARVFSDKPCAELLLRIILQRNDLTVKSVTTQYEIKNLKGRSVTLDIFAVNDKNEEINVEIQRDNMQAKPERARYHSSLIDSEAIDKGSNFEDLPETYVIFITENDVLKHNKPIYHINRFIEEIGERFEDREHIIYVNSKIQDETELGRLMHDFYCTDAADIKNDLLAQKVRYYKEEEGVSEMCEIFEELKAEAREEGLIEGMKEGLEAGRKEGMKAGMKEGMEAGMKAGMKEGMKEGIVSSIKNLMLNMAMTFEQASAALGIPTEEQPKYAAMVK